MMRSLHNLSRHSRESGNPAAFAEGRKKKLDPRFRGDDAEKGFTLVELMVVLVILGLLATIVIINVMPALDRAKTETARTSVRALELAIDNHKLNHGRYPTTEEGLQLLVSGRELRRLEPDPWGNPFVYRAPGRDGRPYDVISLGADGREGGSGENEDISN